MRVWRNWVDTQLKSSYDTMRGRVWYAEEPPTHEKDGIISSFIQFECFLWDTYSLTSQTCSISYCISAVEDIFDWIRSHGASYFFTYLKQVIVKYRNGNQLSSLVSEGYDGLPMLVYRLISKTLHLSDDVSAFRYTHGILCFLSKMAFHRCGLEVEELSKWQAHEDSIVPCTSVVSHAVRSVITEWFHDFKTSELIGGFSNGSTADAGRALSKKISSSGSFSFSALAYLYKHVSGTFMFRGGTTPAEMVFVPKDALHLRGISMEPADKNFFQSAFDRQILAHISFLRNHIRLDDQSYSREMCRSALKKGLATVDLSAASDSVSLSLVETLFADVPEVLSGLLALRSTHTCLPDGRVVKLKKYAPMGSRLTFTLECIIFSSICEAAYRLVDIPVQERVYVVYGDDIIISARVYPTLVMLLTELGFEVNAQKSFHDGLFREACGMYAYKDVDVTLPALGRKNIALYASTYQAEQLSMLTTAANNFYVNGYFLTRYLLARMASRSNHIRYVPLTLENVASVLGDKVDHQKLCSFFLLSEQATNYRLRTRKVIEEWQPREGITFYRYEEQQTVPKWRYDHFLEAFVIKDSKLTLDDSVRYSVMLYRMKYTKRRPILPGIDEPYVVLAGEVVKTSPTVTRWVLT